jgi:hypothetical protein
VKIQDEDIDQDVEAELEREYEMEEEEDEEELERVFVPADQFEESDEESDIEVFFLIIEALNFYLFFRNVFKYEYSNCLGNCG